MDGECGGECDGGDECDPDEAVATLCKADAPGALLPPGRPTSDNDILETGPPLILRFRVAAARGRVGDDTTVLGGAASGIAVGNDKAEDDEDDDDDEASPYSRSCSAFSSSPSSSLSNSSGSADIPNKACNPPASTPAPAPTNEPPSCAASA